ncbi:MAG: glycosyltransferase family 4 protein [Patescibacteria group bacterium]|nr:glycosyltransferase family 4 protein [Patescibacteria group bacterium]MDD5221731.1 glycosyltransferase family 4 protein [Patescibacteria group bacterium]MDD5395780.1 glycosyltransferase family 4 protein [Patescibacteria group bacterium]
MNILIIHQYFLEKNGVGGSRFNQFAKYWAGCGHKVTVVSGMVDYTSGKKLNNYKNKWVNKEIIDDGITVYRCFVSEQYNKNFLGRLWAYFSFVFSSIWAILFCVSRPDVIVTTSPPLFVAIPGYLAKIFKRAPLIFEVRDLWPKFAIDEGILKNKLIIKLSLWLEAFIYRQADLVNVLTPAFEEYLISEKGVKKDKIIYIPNGADLDIFLPGPKDNWVRQQYHWDNKFIILYVGAHGVANNLIQLINVAESLRTNPEILFVLIGNGMEKPQLQKVVREKNLTNIQFLESMPKNKIVDFINAADVCTAVLKKIYTTTYPNKVFDYMSCKKPTILPIDGAARKLVINQAQAGLFVEPENVQQFKEATLRLYQHPEEVKIFGENGYRFVTQNFDRQKLAEKYLLFILNLTNQC